MIIIGTALLTYSLYREKFSHDPNILFTNCELVPDTHRFGIPDEWKEKNRNDSMHRFLFYVKV